MVGVHQLNPDLVRTGGHPGQVNRVVVARVRPPPGQVVNVNVQMSDPWRSVEGAFPEHWYDVHILRPVLNPDYALVQQIWKRRVHDQFGRGLALDWDIG